ncbi:MAG TPA: GTPase Era [Saprospiraceae bacterium]|nr:GTPase Era [Saprospiraceae bacterium]
MRAGFVNIVGMPNAGKSSFLNAIMGTKYAIVSHKPQTTRQRMLCILNKENIQLVFSDSPGFVDRALYKLHHAMNKEIYSAIEDADLLLFVLDGLSKIEQQVELLKKVLDSKIKTAIVINKMDEIKSSQLSAIYDELKIIAENIPVFEVSSKTNAGLDAVIQWAENNVPEHEAYFPADDVSEKPIRYFLSEMIREQIYLNYSDEIPYSTIVVINSCKGVDEQAELVKIDATIMVNKSSQLAIIVGKNGSAIKNLGIKSREAIEQFLGQRVFLGLTAKLKENWREDENFLKKTGINL